MPLLSVSYDLNTPGQNYPAIVQQLQALGAKRILYSQWMLRSSMTASEMCTHLMKYIDANDRLFVADVSNAPLAWYNLQVEIKPAFNLA